MKAVAVLCFALLGLMLHIAAGHPLEDVTPSEVPKEDLDYHIDVIQKIPPRRVPEQLDATTTAEPSADAAPTAETSEVIKEYQNKDSTLDSPPSPTKVKCECAVFNSEAPTESDEAIVSQSPIEVTCDTDGKEVCLKLCSTLAKAMEQHGPQLICASLGHYNHLRASVHSRVCGHQGWIYTGLTSSTEICCHEYQVIDCKDLAENRL